MNPIVSCTRRHVSIFLLASLAPIKSSSAKSSADIRAQNVIALDWGIAETLVALGYAPLGAAEIADYDRTVVAPAMPKSVVDVGLRLSPNPQLMQALNPDLMLINPAQEYMRPILAPFGKVVTVPIYTGAGQPYRLACEAARSLARMMGDARAADSLLTQAESVIANTRARLRRYDGRPLYLIEFIDGRHVAVAGSKSLFQGVLDHLGLRNAWTGATGEWGTASVGIEALAAEPEARVLYLTPLSEDAKRTLASNPLWTRLPFVRERRVIAFPPIWSFGALPSAMRIARLLGDVLTSSRDTNG